MKKNFIVLLIGVVLVACGNPGLMAQASKEEAVAPGMEVVYVGKTKAVVPKGSRVNREEGFIVLESTSEYVGRNFLETNQQFEEIKLWKSDLEREMKEVKNIVEKNGEKIDSLQLRRTNIYTGLAELEAKEQELRNEIDLVKKDIANLKKGTW
ncbi:MAG: hypothetical protein ABH844_04420 [Candidatus Omnitrophota bacterium]